MEDLLPLSVTFSTIVIFYAIRQSGLITYDDMQMIEFFFWTGGILLISAIVFSGIQAYSPISSESPKNHKETDPEHMKAEPGEKKVPLSTLAIGFLVLGIFFLPVLSVFLPVFYSPFHDDNRVARTCRSVR